MELYNDIYKHYEQSGFKFNYSNRRLGKSRDIFEDEINELPSSKHNDDEMLLFVFCKKCGEYMDFEEGPDNALDGRWICPVCGVRVHESTAYHQLEKENNIFMERFLPDDEEDDFRPEDL